MAWEALTELYEHAGGVTVVVEPVPPIKVLIDADRTPERLP